MAVLPGLLRRGQLITGEICTIRLNASSDLENDEQEFNGRWWSRVRERHFDFRRSAKKLVKERLGTQFEVVRVRSTRGSVDILVVIGVVGAVYMTISRYKSFRESLQLLIADLRALLENMLGPSIHEGDISGNWTPEPALLPLEDALVSPAVPDTTQALVWYLILSHAALLAVFLWLVLHSGT